MGKAETSEIETGELSDDGKPSSKRGHFFMVDRRCVEAATKGPGGANAAAAYLALARYTSSRDHSTTQAGMTAICNHTGLSRGRADLALKQLENAGLVSPTTRGTSRKLTPWGSFLANKSGLSPKQYAVIDRVKRRDSPITSGKDQDYQTAYALSRKGVLKHIEAKPGKARFRIAEPEYLFLPNTLADGVREGDLPLSRLRQIGDARAVATLMRVYDHSNLPEACGIPPELIRQEYTKFEAGSWGRYTVLSFAVASKNASWDPFVRPFVANVVSDNAEYKAERERLVQEFWRIWEALEVARLIEHTAYVFDGTEPSAQPLFPLPTSWSGTDEERKVSAEAQDAALRMLSPAQLDRARTVLNTSQVMVCPVEAHLINARLVGVARPCYRAKTKKTAAWVASYLQACPDLASVFSKLRQNLATSIA